MPNQKTQELIDYQLRLAGQPLPPAGLLASIRGELQGNVLQVSSWSIEDCEDTGSQTIRIWRDRKGVLKEVSKQALRSIPSDWRLISTGECKTQTGGWIAIIDIFRQTSEVDKWLAEQVRESVHIFPFIREDESDDTHSALVADTAG